MDMEKEIRKTLPSGAALVVQMGSWEQSHRLYKAVMGIIEGINIEGDDVTTLLSRAATSDKVETAVWDCFGRATYKGAKITTASFEEPEARADYLLVVKEVMVLNLTPFFKSLRSLFLEIKAAKGGSTPK